MPTGYCIRLVYDRYVLSLKQQQQHLFCCIEKRVEFFQKYFVHFLLSSKRREIERERGEEGDRERERERKKEREKERENRRERERERVGVENKT